MLRDLGTDCKEQESCFGSDVDDHRCIVKEEGHRRLLCHPLLHQSSPPNKSNKQEAIVVRMLKYNSPPLTATLEGAEVGRRTQFYLVARS